MTDERAVPFYCPYCGDEDIRPAGAEPGRFRCAACGRAWWLRFLGLGGGAPGGGDPAGGEQTVPNGTGDAG